MEGVLELLEVVYSDKLKGGVTPSICELKNKSNLATFPKESSMMIDKL